MAEPGRDAEQDVEQDVEQGGEAVCWLDRVCPECGGLSDGPPAPVCPRCGAERDRSAQGPD